MDWRKQAEDFKRKNPASELLDPKDLSEEDKKFLKGKHNKLIRWYFYLENGLTILNNFRNLFLGILALYIALHLTNPLLMIVMFAPCVIILTILGWYSVHYLNKVKEFLGVRFSSVYGIRTFDFNADNNKLLREIKELLEKK